MPTKVSIGLSRKAGLPDYGSIGASCHVELELGSDVLDGDRNRFRQHVQRTYAACRQAVEDELALERDTPHPQSSASTNGNGHGNGHHGANGNGYRNGSNGNGRSTNGRSATQSQVRAINAIANRNRMNLTPFLQQRGAHTVADLSIGDASSLIDELKGQPARSDGARV